MVAEMKKVIAISDFPILEQKVLGERLVYLDNAATTQKPRVVIEAMTHFYEHSNANIHRGIHTLSERATLAYENARETVARFIGAETEEIIFSAMCEPNQMNTPISISKTVRHVFDHSLR